MLESLKLAADYSWRDNRGQLMTAEETAMSHGYQLDSWREGRVKLLSWYSRLTDRITSPSYVSESTSVTAEEASLEMSGIWSSQI